MAYNCFKYSDIEKAKVAKKSIPKLWKFDATDLSTWVYLGAHVKGKNVDASSIEWIINPDFKFKHLVRNIDWINLKEKNYAKGKSKLRA